jgi:DNA repair exonuclease SbcCD ATPase subunit
MTGRTNPSPPPVLDDARSVLGAIREAEAQLGFLRSVYEGGAPQGADASELERRRAALERAFDALIRHEDRLQDWHDRLDVRDRAMKAGSPPQGRATEGAEPSEIDRLARQRDALARELSERERVIERLQERIRRMERDIDRAARIGIQRERSMALARAELHRRESQLLAREALVRQAEDELARHAGELDVRALRIDEHRSELDLLFDELRDRETELDEQQARLERRLARRQADAPGAGEDAGQRGSSRPPARPSGVGTAPRADAPGFAVRSSRTRVRPPDGDPAAEGSGAPAARSERHA